MIVWGKELELYLHREPVDFRKSINGLSVIVESTMKLNPFSGACFVFCNKGRDKLKVLYWDNTGFALWYKRLEQDKFKWPKRLPESVVTLTPAQWEWLLSGVDILQLTPHSPLYFDEVS
ncbi:IS66 family insertion sequence element accessory protein TnpB [bacterium]|nr:IS66 family insertion sequence element accessory protein TnpB [bacterium]